MGVWVLAYWLNIYKVNVDEKNVIARTSNMYLYELHYSTNRKKIRHEDVGIVSKGIYKASLCRNIDLEVP